MDHDIDNLKIWNEVCETNPNHTTELKGQAGVGTSIDAYRQIETATALFGPYGQKWGVKDEHFDINTIGKVAFCIYTAVLFYPDAGSIPIHADIEIVCSYGKLAGRYVSNWTKKLATSALTKGLSKLGFNADIFQGKFKNQGYVNDLNIKYQGIIYRKRVSEKVEKKEKKKEIKGISEDKLNKLIDVISSLDQEQISHSIVIRSINKHFKKDYTELKYINDDEYDWLKTKLKEKYDCIL